VKLKSAINHLAALIEQQVPRSGRLPLPPMPPAAEALAVCALATRRQATVLWITRHPDQIEQGRRHLRTFAPALEPFVLPFPPAFEISGTHHAEDPDIAGRRIHTLNRLAELPPEATPVIITCAGAILQPTEPPDVLATRMQTIALEQTLDPDTLARLLVATGYAFESEVLDKGQAARRGGVLDLWPPDSDWPLRIEWFGSVVESLRFFDPASQRAVEKLSSFTITPAQERMADGDGRPDACLLDHIRTPLAVFWSDAAAIHRQAGEFLGNGRESLLSLSDLVARMEQRPGTLQVDAGAEDAPAGETAVIPVFAPLPQTVSLPATAGTAQLDEARKRLLDDLYSRTAHRQNVLIFFDSQGSLEHYKKHLARDGKGPELVLGNLSEGFCAEALQLTIVAESDLYGRRKTMQRFNRTEDGRGRAGRYAGSRIRDFTDMEEDDLVVHADHGVGRYLGVEQITFNGQLQEVLVIEYAEGARLYVPVTHAHLLSRYVGMANRAATLHRLGGIRWTHEKNAAQAAVFDLAAELLEIQASRNLLQGHAFPPDTPMQHEFENAFAFEETADQHTVIREVRADMESTRPMDRLICGDAGYGKTEVAMRAAFKAVQDHRQVAVLVPTTVLAQQHYQTFAERMAGFGVRIEMISRFQPPARRREILKTLAAGETDIIIGTHALVQPGVSFLNLGLVIIDEEQRFGVAHKERLKKVKQLVDVLTLSATPIPRTLYMSMTGARDMSLLRTPPRERVPIETIMAKRSDDIIRDAIRRELARGGQVFFLHNRVVSIRRLREHLASLVPEARIEIAHGQMKSAELSGVMRRFAGGETDVLLCTTIIESGMDIPHANTILIDRADRFGIADLYQLRGRVGRADRKAYAILLLPPHGIVDSDARERIQAVRRHSGLGAGFNLAVRDMEIRGAGNILGAAQSGHISAIGFGLYCQLLQAAVARLKGEQTAVPVQVELRLDFIRAVPYGGGGTGAAALPHDYIPEERLRVAVYRRLAEASSQNALDDLALELADRFGPPPPPVQRLIAITGLRLCASARGIDLIEVKSGKIMLRSGGEFLMQNGRFPRIQAATPDDALKELRVLIAGIAERTIRHRGHLN